MAKQLNVNLAFTADSSKAKTQIQDLQKQLQDLSKGIGTSKDLPITKSIQEARTAAAELKIHLDKAMNVKTGTLDFTKLNQSISQSNTSLQAYGQKLQSLGSSGQQAFASLAKAISNSEIPLRRSNAVLNEFATTLKNTVRWQLSSSMLHGFVGSIESAYRYAQNLDSSLNNIRIVTGQSADQMAVFADRANKAAQSLSTTTTAYTDAALIFYQQGLSDDAVTERTNAVIKMAHATGDAADEVSSYMTAIWNNFDDGSQSLEHYADVITALGASTASSSSEIASGLSQFAAIAETTGLSYEYATSALATLVANTRQSADTIGNSLKTIFSRLQGLSLGETLEDGTNLNKYSKALQKVEVDIKDAGGELRDMDDILDDLAGKWDTLGRAEKDALAQTVAGTRQYTQLIALMDNWDDMKMNLQTANNSDGTLEKQAEIYAESWAAAKDRVKAAWQAIYNDLLDPKVFTGWLNALEKVLHFVDQLIDSMGGLKGVLAGIGALVTNIFQKELVVGLQNMTYSLNMMTKLGQQRQEQTRANFLTSSAEQMKESARDPYTGEISKTDSLRVKVFQDEINLKNELIEKSSQLSEIEKTVVQDLLDQQDALGKIAIQRRQDSNNARKNTQQKYEKLTDRAYQNQLAGGSNVSLANISKAKSGIREDVAAINSVDKALDELTSSAGLSEKSFEQLKTQLAGLKDDNHIALFDQLGDKLTELSSASEVTEEQLRELKAALNNDLEENKFGLSLETAGETKHGQKDADVEAYTEAVRQEIIADQEAATAENEHGAAVERTGNAMNAGVGASVTWAEELMKGAQGISSLIFAFQSLSSIIDTIKDPEMSAWEKTWSIMMSLSMAIPMVVTGLTSLKAAHDASTISATAHAIAESAIGKTIGMVLAKIGLLVTGHIAQAGALNTATVAQIGLNAAMEANPWVMIIAGIAALTVALRGLVAIIKKVVDAFNQDITLEDKLKKSTETANQLSEALKQVKSTSQEMEDDFNNYQSLIDTLESCAYKTEDWYEAMRSVNDEVTTLLMKYPALAKYIDYVDGMAVIQEEGFKELQSEQQKQEMYALVASSMAVKEQNNDTAAIKQEDLSEVVTNFGDAVKDVFIDYAPNFMPLNELLNNYRGLNYNSETGTYDTSGYELLFQMYQAQLEGDLDTVDSLINTFVEGNSQLVQRDDDGEVIYRDDAGIAAQTEVLQDVLAALTGEGGYSDFISAEQVAIVKDLADQFTKNTIQAENIEKDNNATNDAINRQIGYAILNASDVKIDDSEYSDQLYKMAANQASEMYEGYKDGLLEGAKDTGKGWMDQVVKGYGNETETIWDIYSKAMGINSGAEVNYNKDGSFTYKVGDEESETISAEVVANLVAAAQTTEALPNAIQSSMDKMEEVAEKAGNNALSKFMGDKNFDNITSDDFNKLKQDAGIGFDSTNSAVIEDAEKFEAYIVEIFGSLEEAAKTYGYETVDAFKEGLLESVNNTNEGWSHLGDRWLTKTNEAMSNLDLSQTTLETKKQLGDAINKAVADGKYEEVTKALGDASNTTAEDMLELVNAINEAGDSADSLSEKYNTAHKTIDGLSDGDSISADDYDKLDTSYQQYFVKMLDGSYKLVGAAEDLQDALKADQIADYTAELQKLQDENQRIQEYQQNTNLEKLSTSAYQDNGTFDQNLLQEQLDFIDKFAVGNEELLKQSEDWRQHYEDNKTMQVSALQEIGEAVQGLSDEYNTYTDNIETNNIKIQESYTAIANSAEDLDELHQMLEEGTINAQAFTQAAMEMDRINDTKMLDTDELKEYSDYLQEAAENMEGFNKEMDDNEAQIVAKGIMKMNKAIDTLADNFTNAEDSLDSWRGILENSSEGSEEFADAMINTKDAVADLLDVSNEFVSNDFIKSHLDEIEQAATGDADAIDNLKAALSEDIMANIILNHDDFITDAESIQNAYNELVGSIPDIDVGVTLDGEDSFVQGLNNLIDSTNMTVDEVNALCDSLGFEAAWSNEEVITPAKMPATTKHHTISNYKGPEMQTIPGVGTILASPASWDETETVSTSYVDNDGSYTAFAMDVAADGSAPAPHISGVTKKAGGSANNYSSANRGGRSSPGRGSGGGPGGRGSRGREARARDRSDKKKIKHREIEDDLKELKDEKERYHEIELAIDDVNDKVEQYSALADRAFGKSKVKMLREQAKELKKLAANYREELKENQKYLEQDKTDALSYGWQFDNQGNVKNYDEKMAELVKQYNAAVEQARNEKNAAIDWWNSLSGDDQDKESNKDKFDKLTEDAEYDLKKAEELYQDSIDALNKYEETKEKREELIKAQREALEKALDAEVEAVDVVVQVKLDIDDADIKYLEELLDNLGDGADTFVDQLGLMGSKVEELGSKAETSRQGLKDLLGVYTDGSLYNSVDNENGIALENSPISKDLVNKIMSGGQLDQDDINDLYNAGFTEDTISKMQEYVNNLYDINGELRDLRDEALQKTIDAFNEFTDELDRNSEGIEHLQKVTETYKNIIDIVGKKVLDASGELTNQLNRANFNMQRNNTHALKSELDMIDSSVAAMKEKLAELQADNADGQHNEAIKQMEKQLKEMTDKRNDTYESWLDSWEAEMQAAADIYADTLAQIVDDFSKSVAGAAGTLDQLAEEFQRKSDIADIYVDDYEKIYNLSKLTRDIEKSIDDTDNIKSKKALKGLMEEIEELQENGAKLSEYDLENLRRQYELELAKQQLTEAQDAKSQVRMTRDSEGNYGYVYTADESAVADAEQNYEDKLYAMQKANADYINELQNNIISAEQACADALAELDASQFASYEEYQAAVAKIQADYAELIDGYSQQMGNVLENNNDLYNNEWKNYSDMTGYKISADEDYIDSFEETQLSMLTGFNTIEDMQDAFNNATQAATNDMALAWQNWYDDTQTALSDGDTSIQDFGETVDEVSTDVQEQAQALEESAEEMADKYETEYQEILNALSSFCTDYDSMIQNIINSNNQLSKSIADVTKAASGLADVTDKDGNTKTPNSSDDKKNDSKDKKNDSKDEKTNGNGGGGTPNNSNKIEGVAAAIWMDGTKSGWGNDPERAKKLKEKGVTGAQAYINAHAWNGDIYRAWHNKRNQLKKYYYGSFDTGGYTGDWGSSEGKFAMLHQKELVLNASDTENFLQAVDIIRDISQTIDLNALSASNGLATMLQSASTSGSGDSQTLEQEVHITADFSGVKDRGEIEAAFDNLINRAAQFANRKN